MLWFQLSILAALFAAFCAITLKHSFDHYITGPQPVMSIVGLINLGYAAIAFLFFGARFVSPEFGAYAFVSGIVSFGAFYALHWAICKEEVSRVGGLFQTFPILVALLAAFFLKEVLAPPLYFAILLVTLGSITLSFRHSKEEGAGHKITRISGLGLILVSVILFAVALVMDKYSLLNIGYRHYALWHFLGFGVAGALFAVTKTNRRALAATFKKSGKLNPVKFILLAEAFGLSNFIARSFALTIGPVSLVATVSSMTPLFTLLLAIPLVRMWPGLIDEAVDRKSVTLKLAGMALILAGIYLIS